MALWLYARQSLKKRFSTSSQSQRISANDLADKYDLYNKIRVATKLHKFPIKQNKIYKKYSLVPVIFAVAL